MQAPLGRAVIGGLVLSTFATLLVIPSVFSVVIGKKKYGSTSVYPDDQESPHYDPDVYAEPAEEGHNGDSGQPRSNGKAASNGKSDQNGKPSKSTEHHGRNGHDGQNGQDGESDPAENNDEVLIFLRHILEDARSKRPNRVAEYTVDDLRAALGVASAGTNGATARGNGEHPQSESNGTSNESSSRGNS